MAEEQSNGGRSSLGSTGPMAVTQGAMPETLRELLYEIPGFKTLAKKEIPAQGAAVPASKALSKTAVA